MSYILDALRRADAERERGAVPTLHAKPVPEAFADDDGTGRRTQPLLWAVVALSLVLLGVLAWQFMGASSPQAAMAVPSPAPAAPAPVVPLAPPTVVEAPAPLPAPPAAVAASVPAPTPRPPVQAAPRKPVRTAAKAAASAPASTAAELPVLGVSELPDDIRRELPQLTVGGAMYSQSAANRMLILNGQVFHEGDKVAPNLVLEQIKLKSAVLAYKGHRYAINY